MGTIGHPDNEPPLQAAPGLGFKNRNARARAFNFLKAFNSWVAGQSASGNRRIRRCVYRSSSWASRVCPLAVPGGRSTSPRNLASNNAKHRETTRIFARERPHRRKDATRNNAKLRIESDLVLLAIAIRIDSQCFAFQEQARYAIRAYKVNLAALIACLDSPIGSTRSCSARRKTAAAVMGRAGE